MRGLDALAAACAPQEPTNATPAPLPMSDDQCKKIASMVLEQLQGSQPKTEPEEPAEDPAPERGEREHAEEQP